MAEEQHTAMAAGKARPALRSEHKNEHDELTRRARAFQEQSHAGHVAMSVDLLSFLKNWLTSHIQRSDRQYTPYLAD